MDLVRLCRHKFEFLYKIIGITKWVIVHKAYQHRYKSLSQKSGLFVSFWSISCSWIRIRIPNTDLDPDPGMRIQCRSLRIPIYNTSMIYKKTFKNPQHTHKKIFQDTKHCSRLERCGRLNSANTRQCRVNYVCRVARTSSQVFGQPA